MEALSRAGTELGVPFRQVLADEADALSHDLGHGGAAEQRILIDLDSGRIRVEYDHRADSLRESLETLADHFPTTATKIQNRLIAFLAEHDGSKELYEVLHDELGLTKREIEAISNKLDLTLRQKNGMVRHDFFYPLMEEERAHLLKIVEQFCQQHTGKTLNDYYAQLDMERETPPELTVGIKRLSIDAVSFSDEITECDGKLNFYIPINFDPDEVFGTNVASAFNDDWLNVYANFDWKTGRIDSALTVCLVCSDGHEFEFSYPLTPAEQAQLWDRICSHPPL